uniref:RFNG O-fucosylpeptide 3-beta-N-acetylglucosaminyltransferase n=1 Tax=Hippocampus comes TaxID=109280 RepID=A0A3Q2YMB9_HIPCM
MHIASVGVSKVGFLFSLALGGLLLLLIPALQPTARQLDLPQPRPQVKTSSYTLQHNTGPPTVSDSAGDTETATGLSISSEGMNGTIETEPFENDDDKETYSEKNSEALSLPEGQSRILPRPGSRDPLELKDIFIAVKTTRKYHKSRVELLIQTWISQAKEQVRIALCCKMSVEYDKFIESQKKWFCHVDDDNYVILPSLLQLLSSYHHSQDVYLGRPSLDHPIEAAERIKSNGMVSVKFWFATGGAGFCISRGLALKMSPWASLGNFISTAEKIRLPDDCTIGYIIEALLEVALIHTHLFHSHLENLQKLPTDSVLEQVTLSYGGYENRRNVVSIVGGFSLVEDPTRFKTVHCLLYPDTDWQTRSGHRSRKR